MKIIRFLIRSVLVFFVLLLVGGYFMRNMVIQRLQENLVRSSSVVFARPFPITPEVGFKNARLPGRLKRLGYQEVNHLPVNPGEFEVTAQGAAIYLRKTKVPGAADQPEQLVRLTFRDGDTIDGISDATNRRKLDRIWLEPEPLSLLGNTLARASTPKSLERFPQHVVQAVLATEDERFYLHYGIDPVAIGRALVVNVQSGHIAQGGSTITQQLAKNLFFTRERSLARKAFEAIAAVLIETAFTKDQILEFYLNEVFLGQEGSVAIHGFGEAALSFYGKEVERMTIAEAATLAGVIKAPTYYSPRRHPGRAVPRRDVVLGKMKELGFITDAQYQQALKEKLVTLPAFRSRRIAPYFVDYVSRELQPVIQNTNPTERNLKVYTGLDLEYQLCAEDAVNRGLRDLEKQFPRLKRKDYPLQAALVSALPASGEILAWVGGRNYGQNQFDRVSLAKRQPGSTFKPFVYLTALDRGLNSYRPATTINILSDEPTSISIPGVGEWTPENYDKEYRGEVTVREALVRSLNIPTVNLATKVGIRSIKHTAELFGFGSDLPEVPSLALGAGEVTPLQLTRAYSGLAHGGLLGELRPIADVYLDNKQINLYPKRTSDERIASEAAVFVLTDLLISAVNHGTGRPVRTKGFTGSVAGKTGTSNDARDAWFAGYTPHLLTIVWIGFDDNKQIGLTGGQGAAPIWAEYMKCVGKMEPELEFLPPAGVVYKQIDIESGLLATSDCPRSQVTTEIFVEGTEPATQCDAHSYQEPPPEDF